MWWLFWLSLGAVLGFCGGVVFAIRKLSNWIHAIEDLYVRSADNVTSWFEKLFLKIKGVL